MSEQETRPMEEPAPATQGVAPAEPAPATDAPNTPAESLPESLPDQQTAPPEAERQTSTEPPAEPPDAESVVAAQNAANATVIAQSRKHTRRAFVAAAAGAAAGYGFYHWVANSSGVQMQPRPLRRAFRINAAVSRAITRDHALTPTYKLSEARDLRVNGVFGLKQELVPESWRLQVVGSTAGSSHPRYTPDVTTWEYRYTSAESHDDPGHDTKVDPNTKTAAKMAPKSMLAQAAAQEERTGRMPRGREEAGESRSTLMPGTPGLLLTMDDVLALPRQELVTQFKCIEGWSQIVHWAGVRMADFMEAYSPALINGREPKYVYMETPDGDYYTGYDLDVCRHPQTLLVTEMMGAPLTQFHGAPLRLHMPTKYGYKQIKRIGLIAYTNDRPDDYWTKLGYDWYAGL